MKTLHSSPDSLLKSFLAECWAPKLSEVATLKITFFQMYRYLRNVELLFTIFFKWL